MGLQYNNWNKLHYNILRLSFVYSLYLPLRFSIDLLVRIYKYPWMSTEWLFVSTCACSQLILGCNRQRQSLNNYLTTPLYRSRIYIYIYTFTWMWVRELHLLRTHIVFNIKRSSYVVFPAAWIVWFLYWLLSWLSIWHWIDYKTLIIWLNSLFHPSCYPIN